MTVTKVGGANVIAHAQWPQCPPFPRVAAFYVTPAVGLTHQSMYYICIGLCEFKMICQSVR